MLKSFWHPTRVRLISEASGSLEKSSLKDGTVDALTSWLIILGTINFRCGWNWYPITTKHYVCKKNESVNFATESVIKLSCDRRSVELDMHSFKSPLDPILSKKFVLLKSVRSVFSESSQEATEYPEFNFWSVLIDRCIELPSIVNISSGVL